MTRCFTYDGLSLAWQTYGQGAHTLFAFPGFGRPAEDYQRLESQLSETFTIYAFHHFLHHPQSHYPQDRINKNTLRKEELRDWFEHFFQEHQIKRFSLLGYSMGAKVALTLLEFFPDRIDRVLLCAPDGIKINGLYKFASHTQLGIRAYQWMVLNPGPFFTTVRILRSLGLVSKSIAKFTLTHLETPEKRTFVYQVWMIFRHIQPDLQQIQINLNEYKVPLHLVFGRYDKVIPPSIGEKLTRNNPKVVLTVLEAGHNLMTPKHLNEAIRWLATS